LAPTRRDFPKARRLLAARDYQAVFAGAVKSSDRYLTVLARPNGTLTPRLGLAISKRNVRLAVDRNRLKRLVRESFREHQQALGGRDFVVLARPLAAHAESRRITHALKRHWQELLSQCDPSSSRSSASTAS
jgi:ribonuclease P protein component